MERKMEHKLNPTQLDLLKRPRRNRRSTAVRDMIAETSIGVEHLVNPLFLREAEGPGKSSAQPEPIASMPGIYRYSIDLLLSEIERGLSLGIRSVALFPYIEPSLKDEKGSEALNENGLVPKTLRRIKKEFPEVVVFSDIALDPFSIWGHDGIVVNQKIDNDSTVKILVEMALLHAEAGADFVAPSDMMDGRILQIRRGLDQAGYSEVGILSYAAKYASSFYGPFRDALDSAPQFGDKKTYQMDFRNSREALMEAQLDVQEGADIIMVKPALAYLDILAKIRSRTQIPIAAYNVSGEYAMIKAAAQMGWMDGEKAMVESLTAMRRAGSDLIFTYFAMEMAHFLKRVPGPVSVSGA